MKQMYLLFVICAGISCIKAQAEDIAPFIKSGTIIGSNDGIAKQTLGGCKQSCMVTPNCKNFVYNETRHGCLLGKFVGQPQSPSTASFSGYVYYAPGACDNGKAQFTLKMKGSVSICMRISTFKANYASAKAHCEGLGSHLYTAKVVDKKDLLIDTLKTAWNENFWIGLNDIAEERVFRWVDDNSMLSIMWPFIVDPQLIDWANQDCVNYNMNYESLSQNLCASSMRFVCEFDPLL